MLNISKSQKALNKHFRRFPVADIDTLYAILKTGSRMSIFRRLREIGYFSSYTHTGRYYTLAHIPQFDDHGLWIHQGIGFSRFATLKATIVELVNKSATGHTHMELNNLLHIRVHNTLLSLVRDNCVGRELIEKTFLYVSTESAHAAEQISQRRVQLAHSEKTIHHIPATTVIEVLIETIHAGKMRIIPSHVAGGLCARGVPVTVQQVEQVFARYGIDTEKKTVV